jgi:hypothetical protein
MPLTAEQQRARRHAAAPFQRQLGVVQQVNSATIEGSSLGRSRRKKRKTKHADASQDHSMLRTCARGAKDHLGRRKVSHKKPLSEFLDDRGKEHDTCATTASTTEILPDRSTESSAGSTTAACAIMSKS